MISIIVAISDNNVIGVNNTMPWHISEDFRRFKAITTGHPVIMGRRTHESIGRVLPNRRNIVISRNPDLHIKGCEVVGSLAEAVALCSADHECFVIGGGEIFRQAMPMAEKLYITRVHITLEGDTLFPEIDDRWQEVFREEHSSGQSFPNAFTFIDYMLK